MLHALLLGAVVALGQADGPGHDAPPHLAPPVAVEGSGQVGVLPPLAIQARDDRPGTARAVAPAALPTFRAAQADPTSTPAVQPRPQAARPAAPAVIRIAQNGEKEKKEVAPDAEPKQPGDPAATEEKKVEEPPAEEAEEKAATPERWALMRALQGTWAGWGLEGHRTQVYGWTQVVGTAGTAEHFNTPVVWNYRANEVYMEQSWLRIERTVVTDGSTTQPTFGFRSDWLYGTDYIFTLPRGIWNSQLTANDGLPDQYGVDPIAFYGEAYFPTVAKGLDIKVGRFFTPFGVESLEAVSSPTVSKSYTFNWAPPFTHTGFLATLKLSDMWTVSGGLVTGNDIFIDPAAEPRFVGTVAWTQPGGRNSVVFGTSVGRGKFDAEEAFNNINVFDVVWNHTINERSSTAFEVLYGYQTGFERPDDGRVTTTDWLGMAGYYYHALTPRARGMVRLELFDDFEGARTGFEGLYAAATVGVTWKPKPWFWVRPELRYDHNFQSRPFEDEPGLFTATADVILRW